MTRPRLAFLAAIALAACSPPADVEFERIDPEALMGDVRALSADDMEGRETGTPGAAKARAYLAERFEEIGIVPFEGGYEQPFTFRERARAGAPEPPAREGINMIGRIEGEAGAPILVVSAHYDHEGLCDGAICNGADDNASGVAAMLAIAEALIAEPARHTVIFAAFDGEELGLRGAYAYVADPATPIDDIGFNINLDMISRNDAGEIYAAGANHYPFMRARIDAIAARAPVTLKQGHDSAEWDPHDWTERADQAPFHEKGIPFIYFGVEDHPLYHHPDDVADTIPVDFYTRVVETILMTVRAIDADLETIVSETGN